MTSYSLRKLMARATRAHHAYDTAVARALSAEDRAAKSYEKRIFAREHWQLLELELAKAKAAKT